MAIKKYKRSDKIQLTKNFQLDEFKCKCGKCDPILVDEKLVARLQQIRDHFGESVIINSGYRCEKHNKAEGGATGSRHTKGQAADFYIPGVAPAEIAKFAESIGILGIGLYEGKDNFVHIDTRTSKSFWKGHAQIPASTFGGKPQTSLQVDGTWGPATTTRLQQIFGTPVDGKVSNQRSKLKTDNPGLIGGWEWEDKPNGKGSQLIKALQEWAGMPSSDRDGEIGPKTIKALQKKLGTPVDGCVDNPSQMVKALQQWANKQ